MLAEDGMLDDLADFCAAVFVLEEEYTRYQIRFSSRRPLLGDKADGFE
jgi:hypothetical protein